MRTAALGTSRAKATTSTIGGRGRSSYSKSDQCCRDLSGSPGTLDLHPPNPAGASAGDTFEKRACTHVFMSCIIPRLDIAAAIFVRLCKAYEMMPSNPSDLAVQDALG